MTHWSLSGVLKEHCVFLGGFWLPIIFTHEHQGKERIESLTPGNEPNSKLESIRKMSGGRCGMTSADLQSVKHRYCPGIWSVHVHTILLNCCIANQNWGLCREARWKPHKLLPEPSWFATALWGLHFDFSLLTGWALFEPRVFNVTGNGTS